MMPSKGRGWWSGLRAQFASEAGARSRGRAGRRRRARVECLESRELLTANLYVDFGDNFTSAGLATSVGLVSGTVGLGTPQPLMGPDLTPYLPGSSASTPLNFRPLSYVANGDYNGDGVSNSSDVPALEAGILSYLQRSYAPFDVNVQQVASPSVTAISNQVRSNSSSNDTYLIITYATRTDTGASVGAQGGLLGIAPQDDIISRANNTDDTVLVFADNILASYQNGLAAPALGFVATHESGHSLGLVHTDPGAAGSDNDLLTGSDVMVIGGTPQSLAHLPNYNFFTRYNVPAASPQSGTYNPALQLLNDPKVGARPGAPAYVTGTGAHDSISISVSSPGNALVSVFAYRDAAHTSLINSFGYTVPTANGILVEAGAGNDTVTVDSAVQSTVEVRGMTGADVAAYFGPNVATTFAASATQVSITGGYQPMNFNSEVERVDLYGGSAGDTFFINAPNAATGYGISGGGGADIVAIVGPAASTNYAQVAGQISLTGGYQPISYGTDVERVDVYAGAGNDTFFITAPNASTGFGFNGGGGGDIAAIFGPNTATNFTQSAGQVAISGGYQGVLYNTDVERVDVYGGAGNDVYFITAPNASTGFGFSGGGGGDIEAVFGPSVGTVFTQTAGQLAIGGGYQSVLYNPDVERVDVYGGAGNDVLTVNAPSTTTGFGFSGGGGGDIEAIFGPNVGTTFSQSSGLVTLSGGYQGILYNPDVERVDLYGGTGNDTFLITAPSTTTAFFVIGGAGTDTLNFSLPAGLTTIKQTNPKRVTFSNPSYQPVYYSDDTENVNA